MTNNLFAFSSRSLHPAEKNSSQIEKEALVVTFGVHKSYNYVFGKLFTIDIIINRCYRYLIKLRQHL